LVVPALAFILAYFTTAFIMKPCVKPLVYSCLVDRWYGRYCDAPRRLLPTRFFLSTHRQLVMLVAVNTMFAVMEDGPV
jgi:hypothetical protein